jgi:hypothetical protein
VIGWLLTHGPARKALGLVLATAAILLFLLNLRRAGERAGRAAERLDARERNDAIHRQILDAAARRPADRAMLWLSACATVGSDNRAPCPTVVDYTAAEQARAADEVEALPEGAVVVRMLSDYAVLRDQARACQ